jgi:hypothetical protein
VALHASRRLPHSALAGEFLEVLAAHFRTHTALAPQDVYKLIYQRVFGPEHSIDNLPAARERLYLEILHLPEGPPAMPLLEPLSATLCRLNLHPLMHSGGGNVAAVWRAFKQTVREFQPGTVADLQRHWRLFLASPWAERYAPAALEQYWQCLATEGFPAVHHSRDYTAANAPHYRVVLRSLGERLL